jgi:L-ascorbate metabolism protein UlaG (beta-lactamase superfamily)
MRKCMEVMLPDSFACGHFLKHAIASALAAFAIFVSPSSDARTPVQLQYLGTAGWQITHDKTVVLIDPFLSRPRRVIPNDDTLPGDIRPLLTNDDIAQTDTAVVDAHIQRADFILVTHTHYDHTLDIPYIARKTGAMVIGTESTRNLLRAHGISGAKILVVRGGEDYELGALSVRVIPSLHGVLRRAPFLRRDPDAPPPPAVFPSTAKPPFRFREMLIEGGTLAYLIRVGGRQILAFGSMNYIEREIEGLRPDVALVGAMPDRHEIYDYTGRLLRALGHPRLVLPTHWDRFNVTYDVSQAPAIERLQPFLAEVKAASPKTKVIVPRYFEPISVP